MCIIKIIFITLQQNAEWLCAIAIVYFAYKQYAITKLQIEQDLRMRRLELAQKLDTFFIDTPMNKEKLTKFIENLLSCQSEFIFLLQEQDLKYFRDLVGICMNLRNKLNDNNLINPTDIEILNKYVFKLDLALGNAKYGLTEIKSNKK